MSQLNVTRIVAYQQKDGRRLQKFARHFLADLFKHRLNHRPKGGLECLSRRLMPLFKAFLKQVIVLTALFSLTRTRVWVDRAKLKLLTASLSGS